MKQTITLDNSLIYFDEDTGEEFIFKKDLDKFLEQFKEHINN